MEPELDRIIGYVVSDHDLQSGKRVILSSHHVVSPMLQSGPTCGLVGLTLASNLLRGVQTPRIPNSISSDSINYDQRIDSMLVYAKEKGLSKQGEMFSVEYMSTITVNKLQLNARVIDTTNSQEFNAVEILFQVLLGQEAVLVPYDADRNHSPCSARGHKAHWCVLVGVCLVLDNLSQEVLKQCRSHQSNPFHFTMEPYKLAGTLKEIFALHPVTTLLDKNCIYVFARQGKSTHLGLWSFKDLLESNRNLLEVDPKRSDCANYVVPVGGLQEGLQNKILIIGK